MDNDRIFAVSVLEGSHAGATVALSAGTYRFGRSRDADVVLTDAGVAPLHFTMALGKQGASVQSLDGAVMLDGRSSVASRSSAQLHFPFEVALDGVRLRVDGPERHRWERTALEWYDRCQDWVEKSHRAPLIAALAIVPLSVYAIGATSAPDDAVAARVESIPVERPLAIPAAVDTLRDRAKDAGLLPQLQIEPAGEAISVRGSLVADQLTAWQGIRRAFDSEYGNRYAFDSRIETASSVGRPQLELQAIWAGNPPYVITGDGERLREGDRLTTGWTIEKIEPRRIVLSQGDQHMALTY